MSDNTDPDNIVTPGHSQTSMFDAGQNPEPSAASKALSSASVTMKGTRSLARLRDRVNLAVKELERLQSENRELRKELERINSISTHNSDGTAIVFTESAGELRSRIELCIQAIDSHMKSHGADSKTESTTTRGEA